VPESDPDAPTHDLVQRDAHLDVALRGRPALETFVALFAELEQLTPTDGELRVLIDESEIDAGLLGSPEIRAMMAAWEGSDGLRERSRIAIYAPSDLVYGLSRMAQAYGGTAADERLAVFRTKDAARDWLLGHQVRPPRAATIGRHLGDTNDLRSPNTYANG
jgi:hypothetical protein